MSDFNWVMVGGNQTGCITCANCGKVYFDDLLPKRQMCFGQLCKKGEGRMLPPAYACETRASVLVCPKHGRLGFLAITYEHIGG
jgi:hypothetical protein